MQLFQRLSRDVFYMCDWIEVGMMCWLLPQEVGEFLLVLDMSLHVLETLHCCFMCCDLVSCVGGASTSIGGS